MAENKESLRGSNRRTAFKQWIRDHKLGIPKLAQQIIAAIIALLVAAGGAYLTKKSDEEIATEAVAKLFADSTLENFKEKLGGEPQIERDLGSLRELMWINEIYAVKAFTETGKNGVVGYTVTTRTPGFAPEIPLKGLGKLGGARFSAIDHTAYFRAGEGFRWYWYYDEAIGANAYTNYETLLLGAGSSGLGAHSAGSSADISAAIEAAEDRSSRNSGPFLSIPENSARFADARKQLVITTYGYLSDTLQLRELPGTFMLAPSLVDDNKYPARR